MFFFCLYFFHVLKIGGDGGIQTRVRKMLHNKLYMFVAVYIFNSLQNDLSADRYGVHSVTVCETDNSGVTYFGE